MPTDEQIREALADYERPALAEWMEDHPMLGVIMDTARMYLEAREPDYGASGHAVIEAGAADLPSIGAVGHILARIAIDAAFADATLIRRER